MAVGKSLECERVVIVDEAHHERPVQASETERERMDVCGYDHRIIAEYSYSLV